MKEHKEIQNQEFEPFLGYQPCISKLDAPNQVKRNLLHWLDNPVNFLVYIGDPGCGKTYFCDALAEKLGREGLSYEYYNQKQLMNRIKGVNENNIDKEIDIICDKRFLIIDDCFNGMDSCEKQVLHDIIDIRSMSNLPTVITSTLRLLQIEESFGGMIGKRVFSRLSAIKNTQIDSYYRDLRHVYE